MSIKKVTACAHYVRSGEHGARAPRRQLLNGVGIANRTENLFRGVLGFPRQRKCSG
jgi:hypothetical protein